MKKNLESTGRGGGGIMNFVLIRNLRSFSHHVHAKILVTTNTTAREKLYLLPLFKFKTYMASLGFFFIFRKLIILVN